MTHNKKKGSVPEQERGHRMSKDQLTKFMKVHAIVFWTRLVLHKVGTVLRRPQRGLQSPPVDKDVVDGVYRAQRVLRLEVRHVRARARTLLEPCQE